MMLPATRVGRVERVTRYWILAIGLFVLYLSLAIGTAWTKLPWEDEGWFASPAVTLLANGYMGTPVLQTPEAMQQGLSRHTYWIPPLYLVAQAGWYKLFGFSLFTMRTLSIVCGLLALCAWCAIAFLLSGHLRVALVATSLLVIDPTFVGRAAEGRMDMMCTALGASGLAAYLYLRRPHLIWAVLSGHLLVALSCLTHPAGALYVGALAFLGIYFDRDRLGARHFVVAFIPYALAAVGWGVYISENPALFVAQIRGNASGRFGGITAPFEAIRAEIVERYLKAYGLGSHWSGRAAGLRLLVLVAYVVAIGSIAWNRSVHQLSGVRAVLWLTAFTFATMTFFEGAKYHVYLAHILPLVAMLVAASVMLSWPSDPVRGRLMSLAAVILVTVQLGGVVYSIARDRYHREYLPAAQFLAGAARGRTITGSAELGFHVGFSQVRDDRTLGYPDGEASGLVAINARYVQAWQWNPAVREYTNRLLNDHYRRVYSAGGYIIYARLDDEAASPAGPPRSTIVR
jgi:4-amino-4-deoxy-L-arabinose transferase-like glycosyltransferase